jgi:hypothetical protein
MTTVSGIRRTFSLLALLSGSLLSAQSLPSRFDRRPPDACRLSRSRSRLRPKVSATKRSCVAAASMTYLWIVITDSSPQILLWFAIT